MAPMWQESSTGPPDRGPDRDEFGWLLNTVIKRRGSRAHLSPAEKRLIYNRVTGLLSWPRGRTDVDPSAHDGCVDRKLLELAVEQVLDQFTNGDLSRIIRRKRLPTTNDPMALGSLESLHDDPADAAIEREAQERAEATIDSMDERTRTAVYMRSRGASIDEICRCLGCVRSTVQSLLAKARKALAESLHVSE